MQTNTPNGMKFKMADGSTISRNGILALKTAKGAITASGSFGKTTVHSPIMVQHGTSLITIDGNDDLANIHIEQFDIAMIKATHLTRKFGHATIGKSSKA